MENASKALLMAGGILIALLIVGALFLMFSNLGVFQDSQDAQKKASQIAEFNNQFMPYDKDDLTLMEVKSLYNKIISNNNLNDEKINTNIESVYKFSNNNTRAYDINTPFNEIGEKSKQIRVFYMDEIKYGSSGKINVINIKEKMNTNRDKITD